MTPVVNVTGGVVQTQRLFDLESLFFLGYNLEMLRRFVPDESVDLIYLDPPFNSNATYNMLFKQVDGTPVSAQIKAFGDTWEWSLEAELAYKEILESGGDVSRALRSFRELLGPSNMLAYLAMMAPRLLELRRVLRPTGSIYLHCDQTASHYLKLLMDGIFGPERFLNEINWKRTYAHGNAGRNFASVTDVILFYSKGPTYTWNQVYTPMEAEYIKRRFTGHDADGRRWQSVTLRNPSPRPNLRYAYNATNGKTYEPHPNGWAVGIERMTKYDREHRLHYPARVGGQLRLKMYEDESKGIRASNLWEDIFPINSQAQERLGYPTQKPLALLERIISTSSSPGDTVLDPFCGCGTAIDAAEKLGRRWIGIDIAKVALEVIEKRLKDNYPGIHYKVRVIPTTIDEVDLLAARDKYGYQQWVCDLLGIKAEVRKGADRGIDGELVRYEVDGGEMIRTIVSVKGGGVNVSQVRDLRGTIERENAQVGIFVSHKPPTSAMRKEALAAGLTPTGIPRIQLLTSADLIDGRGPQLPIPIQVGRVAEASTSQPRKRARRRA